MDKVLVLQVVVREQSTCEKSLGFSHGDELDLLQVVHRCCRWTRTHRSRCKRCWAKVSITVRLPSWHQCVFILAGGPRQGLRGAGGAGQRYRLQSGCHLGINVFLYPCRWTRTKRLRCRWCWAKVSITVRYLSWHQCVFLPLQVDPDKAFAVQVVLEESVVNSRISYVQCALLYTNSSGERRIRCGLSPVTCHESRCLRR